MDVQAIAFGAVTVAFAVAVFVRFYGLGDTPSTLVIAERKLLSAALEIADGRWIGLWSESLGGQPTGAAFLAAPVVLATGESGTALRLLWAVLGVATVTMLFAFCRLAFSTRVAVLAALLLAFSSWHLQFSRLALPAAIVPLVELAVAFLLLSALADGRTAVERRRLLLLAGLCFGVGFYFHNGWWIFAVAVAAFWAREFLAADSPLDVVARRAWTFAVPALLMALPFFAYIAVNPTPVDDRVRAVAVTGTPEFQERNGLTEQTRHVVSNVARAAGTLVLGRSVDANGDAASYRLLDLISAILVVVGLAVAAWHFKRRVYFLPIALLASTLLAAALTNNLELHSRMLVALPAVFVLGGLGLDWLFSWLKGRLSLRAEYGFVAAVIMLVAWLNLTAYYRAPTGPDETLLATGARPSLSKVPSPPVGEG